jgi:hypothetical protein
MTAGIGTDLPCRFTPTIHHSSGQVPLLPLLAPAHRLHSINSKKTVQGQVKTQQSLPNTKFLPSLPLIPDIPWSQDKHA